MRNCFILFIFLYWTNALAAQQASTVFEAGKEGFASFRIPAMLRLSGNKIIAFAEGRVKGAADFGNIKIVTKLSEDNGATWSPLKIVVENGILQAGNPAPVVDYLDPDYPAGKIFLFYNTGNASESEVRKGKGKREVYYIYSVNQGLSWSSPINITNQVNPSNEDWRSYANTPGHATQCEQGKYKGRIYIAANHSEGPPQPHFKDYTSHGYYTDDHGKTFHLSASLTIKGSNEATAAFISGDRFILNARNQSGEQKSRIVAYSKDGGVHFDTSYFDLNLPDPICQATLLNIGSKKGKSILAFVNAADTLYRNHLTLKLSFDEGKTWPIQKSIDQTSDSNKASSDYTAYSDIVRLGKRKIGVLYELDNYSRIIFKQVSW